MPELPDRRKHRSRAPLIALRYQLEAVRRDAQLEALVLADDAGCLIAASGDSSICEEIAAHAPLLLDRDAPSGFPGFSTSRTRAFELKGSSALLCAHGGNVSNWEAWFGKAQSGCLRILAETA